MVKIANVSGKLHSCVNLHGNNTAISHNYDIHKATSKTTTFFKRNLNENALHSVAFGQLCEQEITFRHKDSKQMSVLRRRWSGYSVKSEDEHASPPVFLKYDEVTYPISTEPLHSTEVESTCAPNIQNFAKIKRTWRKWWILILMCFPLCAILIGRNFGFQNTCMKVFDTQIFRDILNENVFGQDQIKEQLLAILKNLNPSMDSDLKFIIFSGSSGVGKTYVASLLTQFFPWPENIYQFIAPIHFDVTTNIIHKHLSYCGYNLVIIDDLKETDVSIALDLKRDYTLLYKENLLKIIVIMIFSTGQNLSVNNDVKDFNMRMNLGDLIENEKSVNHLKFEPLKETEIMKCIEKSMYWRGVSEPLALINKLSNNFMSNFLLQDGCKRVSSKVSVFLEMHRQKKETADRVKQNR